MSTKPGGSATLLPPTTITTAVTGTVGPTIDVSGIRELFIEGAFTYGSGGTTAKFWIQTRSKGGTWRDIANFARTTASLTTWHKIASVAVAAAIAASDAALADNTILDGFLGDELRVKYTTTGTYAGGTTIAIKASAKY